MQSGFWTSWTNTIDGTSQSGHHMWYSWTVLHAVPIPATLGSMLHSADPSLAGEATRRGTLGKEKGERGRGLWVWSGPKTGPVPQLHTVLCVGLIWPRGNTGGQMFDTPAVKWLHSAYLCHSSHFKFNAIPRIKWKDYNFFQEFIISHPHYRLTTCYIFTTSLTNFVMLSPNLAILKYIKYNINMHPGLNVLL